VYVHILKHRDWVVGDELGVGNRSVISCGLPTMSTTYQGCIRLTI